MTARTVSRGLDGVLLVPGAADLALPVLLRYSAADPLVVRAVLLLEGATAGGAAPREGLRSVEWVFARDLLVVGLTGTASEGGVTVRVEGREVLLELGDGAPGTAALALPLPAVVELLTASLALVPSGAEGDVAAAGLDEELAALLEG